MLKRDELSNPSSCLNKAKDDELLWVCLERDLATPGTIRFWIGERLRLGLNAPGDEQLRNAEEIARQIEARRTP